MIYYSIANEDGYSVFLTTSIENVKRWYNEKIKIEFEDEENFAKKDYRIMLEMFKPCILTLDDYEENINECPTLSYEEIFGNDHDNLAEKRDNEHIEYPEFPKDAFSFYYDERHDIVKKKNPNFSLLQLNSLLDTEWFDADHGKYIKMAIDDKKRYKKELALYKETHKDEEFTDYYQDEDEEE